MSDEAADPSQDPNAPGGKPAKAGNPLIPLIIAVVASTAISFVMVKFVFAPGLEKKIKAELAPAEEGAEGAAAEPAKEAPKDAHGAPAKEAPKDAHGAPAKEAPKDAHGAPYPPV